MKNMKRTLAALLAAAMTLPAFACGEKIPKGEKSSSLVADDGNSESEGNDLSGENSAEGEGGEENSNAENVENNGGENAGNSEGGQSQGGGNAVAEENIVTDQHGGRNTPLSFEQPENLPEDAAIVSTVRGDDGKLYVAKTDINGAVVTEANGNLKTEVYTGVTNAASYSDKNYVPAPKTYQAYWLDISQQKDFVFDGNLLEIEIKVDDNAKDGVYPVEVYFADFSNYSANTDANASKMKDVAFRTGYVCVNSDQPKQEELGTKMTLTPDVVSAKPGETVRMNIRIDNNPGIVAFVIRMHYDSNAMTITRGAAGSDLGKRAYLTTATFDD